MFRLFQKSSNPIQLINGVDIVLSFSEGEITAIGQRRNIQAGQSIGIGGKVFAVLEIEYYSEPSDMFWALLEEERS